MYTNEQLYNKKIPWVVWSIIYLVVFGLPLGIVWPFTYKYDWLGRTYYTNKGAQAGFIALLIVMVLTLEL